MADAFFAERAGQVDEILVAFHVAVTDAEAKLPFVFIVMLDPEKDAIYVSSI